MMVDLDVRQGEGKRPKPEGELEEVQVRKEPCQRTRNNKSLPTFLK